MSDDQGPRALIDHVLDHPCPECRAPAGIECGHPDGWGTDTDPTPQLEHQCPSRVAAGHAMHAALTVAIAERRWTRSAGGCPSWCDEHMPVLENVLHTRIVGSIPTAALGELHVALVAWLDDPGRAAVLVVDDDGEGILARPLERAAELMPALLTRLTDTHRQASGGTRHAQDTQGGE